MTTASFGGPSPRRKVFDVIVDEGDSITVTPSALEFNILAVPPEGAGTYSIQFSVVGDAEETGGVDDWQALNNSAGDPNSDLSNGGSIGARTSVVYSPGVQRLKFSASSAPTRFIGYGK